MRVRSAVLYAVVICLSLAGGVAKALRYADRHTLTADAIDMRVTRMFTQSGWRELPLPNGGASTPYARLIFKNTACPNPITVSFLSANVELRRLVELNHGGDVIFVQHGRVTKQPRTEWRFVNSMFASLSWDSQERNMYTLPLIAISPVPNKFERGCRLPFERDG